MNTANIIALLAMHLITVNACPRACRCDSRHNVYCNERELVVIPYGIPEDTQTLHLQINNITNSITADNILASLSNLVKLDLHQNELTSVPKSLPRALQYVDFRMNNIKYVGKSSFKGSTQLRELHLDGNSIVDRGLSSPAFDNTVSLEVLVLSHNSLTEFPAHLPGSLQVLRLENNQIGIITETSTQRLRNLISLDLSQNFIVQTEIDIGAMTALSSLQTLDMSQNQLTEIPENLPETIEELLLSHNRIEYLYSSEKHRHGSLKSLSNLRRLDLSFNNLKSIETSTFLGLHIDSIELQENPWQCDCYLLYLKQWLSSDVSTLSGENKIRCQSPSDISSVTLNSIEEEDLVCKSRTSTRKKMNVLDVSSNSVYLNWIGSLETPDPPFIRRSVLYGPLKCINCSIFDLSPAEQRRVAISYMRTYTSKDITFSLTSNPSFANITLDSLQPETRYAICMFDSEQHETDISIEQCVEAMTLPHRTAIEPHHQQKVYLPLWIFILCGVLVFIVCSVLIGFCIWKKTKSLKSKTPRPYAATHYLTPEHYMASFPETVGYRTTLTRACETNRSDRTYAECGPASTGPRTIRDSAVDARMEFEVLLKADSNTAPKRIHTPISSSCSEYQDNSTMSTSQTGRLSVQHHAGSSPPPTYDSLHSYSGAPLDQRSSAMSDPLPNGRDPTGGSYV